jgi:hypothetical protein
MAADRQIAANRGNASRSSGPRSQAGKRRASRNSYQHGLSKPATFGRLDRDWIEHFAHAATRGHRTLVTLELGRSAAVAQLDLLRVQQTRAAIVGQLYAAFEKPRSTTSSRRDRRDEISLALLRLKRLDRYEQRAAWARNKALRQICSIARDARTEVS